MNADDLIATSKLRKNSIPPSVYEELVKIFKYNDDLPPFSPLRVKATDVSDMLTESGYPCSVSKLHRICILVFRRKSYRYAE
jgi:hypothetical protein